MNYADLNRMTREPRPGARHAEIPMRPEPREPGFEASLETARAEDELLRVLRASGLTPRQQAATAVELARRCVQLWGHEALQEAHGADRAVFQVSGERHLWIISQSSTGFDASVIEQLHEIVDSIPWDAGAIASLNAAKYLVQRASREAQH